MRKNYKRNMILVLILLVSSVLSSGMGPRNTGPGMMRSSEVFVDNEYEYLVHMIPHHQEAVDNAEILRDNTDREEMRDFAERIIQTQTEEIELMQSYLNEWYPNEAHEVAYDPMMGDYENITGEELDEAFLEDMIPHHMEAVMMSQQLLMRGLAEHEEVAVLADNIRDNQLDEIDQMDEWLSEWNSGSSWTTGDNDSSWMNWDNNSRGMMRGTDWSTIFLWAGLILLGIILIVVLLFHKSGNNQKPRSSRDQSAKELLDIRLAKGEISEEEYQQRRKHLEE